MKKIQNLIYIALFLIVAFGFFLRTFNLSSIPPGLNRDEASIGYTSFSLLETGKDEYGISWPVSFKSFGDWKLPLYIYLTLPFIKIFGLNEFAVRFPSALLGSATVILVYFLIYELFKETPVINQIGLSFLSLLGSFFVAISPWHIFMSRNASESNTTVLLIVVSLLFFFKSRKRKILLFPAFVFLSLTFFTYHGSHIFSTLLFIGLIFLYRKNLYKNQWLLHSVVIFIILVGFIVSKTLFVADKTKIGGLFPLGDEARVHEEVVLKRMPYKSNQIVATIFHNKAIFLTRTIIHNYLKSFSPEFLFVTGGSNKQQTIPNFGNLYTWQSIVLPVAIYCLIRRKEKHMPFFLYWLFISPIAASITKDAPHTNRMMGFLPLPEILTAYGVIAIIIWFQKKKVLLIGLLGLFLLIVSNFAIFVDQYYIQFPHVSEKDWGGGYKNLVAKLSDLKSSYSEIIMERPYESPYIYYIFYQGTSPEKFQREVKRYSQTKEGFHHVRKFENITFKKIDWKYDILIPERLYIDWVEGVSKEATISAHVISQDDIVSLQTLRKDTSRISPGSIVTSKLIDTIYLSNGAPQFYLIETKTEHEEKQ